MKSTELDQAWKSQCTGPGSTENKHKLLGVFLKENGKLKNSQAYLNEIGKLCKESGHSVTEEWMPFETMKVAYGLNELCRRLKKGSEAEQEATDPDVFKADEISNKAGQDKGKNAMERINNMHRLMTKVMKESNGKSKKVLIAPMQLLDRVKANKKVPKMDELKGLLFDCAVAVKQCKKLQG